MPELVTLSEADFASQVLDSAVPVLVDFSAPWCVPCRRMEPELVEFARQWEGKLRLVRMDVDQVPDIAAHYGVLSVPTLILFIGGQPRQRLSGYQPQKKIAEKFVPELS
jgi:thioredoxin 1